MIIFLVLYIIAIFVIEYDIRWNYKKYNRMSALEVWGFQFCPVINLFYAVKVLVR